ncbi:LAGLIDADG family homing endonuclease [Haloferax larsenii]|uniref:DNA helicase n=1 Tax=Haloferax larsenii TaxID=302484 RepID=A0A1H7L3A8_HALLR|nr:LAGLIDADG family homing endonuclease [Haloferax larsenii]SEK92747.1 replicative DNA helicase Mcm [Haloferax larsenii]
MSQAPQNRELTERFIQFYRNYYREEIGDLAQQYPKEKRSLYIDYDDLYNFDPELADDYVTKPGQYQEYAEEALRLFDLPADVKLGQAHVRMRNLPDAIDIRNIRVNDDHIGTLISVQGIVRKATDVRPKITEAAFECQRCGTMSYIPQGDGGFQEPHECQGCERQGPFRIEFDQSNFVDSQKLRVQESPEGLRGGETPQSIDINLADDVTGKVTAGDHVTVVGILHIEQQTSGNEKTPVFDYYMEGIALSIEDEEFEDMEITDDDVAEIVELSNEPNIYEKMVDSVAPAIYGYEQEKLAMILQLFSGVTKHLPDGSRIRGDLHMLLIGDPGTGKSQMLSYIRHIAPRSVYTSGKGSSSAGLTAAAVRDDFGDGQQWTLEAGALVLADKGIAAVDELDKMRCVTGDSLVHLADGGIRRIRDLAHDAARTGSIEELPNGRTIRNVDAEAWTMAEDGTLVTRPVTAIHEYDAPDELTQVTLQSGEQLTAIHDHPFITYEDGERVEKPAEEVSPGDWVYVPRHLSPRTTDGGIVTAEPTTEATTTTTERGLSPALGAVLGYLSGDGNVYYDQEAGSYGIRFTNKEEELLADFEQVCRDAFDAEPVRPLSEQRSDGVETVRLPGREYADAVLEAGMNLEVYDGKAFPSAVSEASLAAKAAFIRAMADSEGCVDTDTGNVKISSSSYELLLGIKSLLLEFGVTTQIQHRERSGERDLYVLAVTAADSLRRFNRHIGFTLGRKQSALEEVCESASGDRTILDVIPSCGGVLSSLRDSLRLHVSECGLVDATYCNFENGDANISFSCAQTVLNTFESRTSEAKSDAERLSGSCDWGSISDIKERYHVSQSELATGTSFSQQQISRLWGEDSELKAVARDRLQEIVEKVAATDLEPFRRLVRGDVKWRHVKAVETVDQCDVDDRIKLLKHELAELLGVEVDAAVEHAQQLLDHEQDANDWDELRTELDHYGVSFAAIARDLGVAGSTVSRWFNGVVETDRFGDVAEVAESRFSDIRSEVQRLLNAIESRSGPKVYDLTVEGTHNFVANGMIVHNSEDRSAMHEGLEQQQISVSKAGINATLKSRCSLLGAANPKYGRFDQYEPIGEQIDLEPALISRFDLIFTVTDDPDPDTDAELAEHIIKTNYAGELNTQRTNVANSEFTEEQVNSVTDEVAPDIDAELLRKYIAYSKRTCYPTLTEEAKNIIRDFYVDFRARGADEDAPVPVTARKLEALVRLSEASARVRLSDKVTAEDAERVTGIVESCLRDIGMDPETGEFDADIVETGRSKTQRDRIKNLLELIRNMQEEYEEGAPHEEVVERANAELNMDEKTVGDQLEKLKMKGDIYEPRGDVYRAT